MLPAERKSRILAILRERREVSVQALAEIIDVPGPSIRRDLRELEEESRITRRHGRAIYRPTVVPVPLEQEGTLAPELLDELVEETAYLLGEARNLFLSSGPVLVRVAKKLSHKTIATHDLTVAMAAAAGDNDVSLVGRELDNRTLTLRSASFEAELQSHWFDAAVVETDGIDEKNLWVARQSHALLPHLLARADSFVAVAKSTDLGRKGDRVAGPLTRADVIVLDKGASEESRKTLVAAGIDLRIAGQGEGAPFALDQVGNVYVFKRLGGRTGGAAGGAGAGGSGGGAAAALRHEPEGDNQPDTGD